MLQDTQQTSSPTPSSSLPSIGSNWRAQRVCCKEQSCVAFLTVVKLVFHGTWIVLQATQYRDNDSISASLVALSIVCFVLSLFQLTQVCNLGMQLQALETSATRIHFELDKLQQQCEDIQRDLDTSLKQKQDIQLQQTNARGMFLHELRNPLNVLVHTLDYLGRTLNKSWLTSDQTESLEDMRINCQLLQTVINQGLDFERLQTGRCELECIPFDMGALLSRALRGNQPSVGSRHIDMQLQLDPKFDTLDADINGDPARLLQILNNLLQNALKFTEKGSIVLQVSLDSITWTVAPPSAAGSPKRNEKPMPPPPPPQDELVIDVKKEPMSANNDHIEETDEEARKKNKETRRCSTQDTSKHVVRHVVRKTSVAVSTSVAPTESLGVIGTAVITFQIHDTGIGIDEQSISSLFAPYTQASLDVSRRFGGTGLGLCIVKSIVDCMQGKIIVRSRVSQGTTFVVTIPWKLTERSALGRRLVLIRGSPSSGSPTHHPERPGSGALVATDARPIPRHQLQITQSHARQRMRLPSKESDASSSNSDSKAAQVAAHGAAATVPVAAAAAAAASPMATGAIVSTTHLSIVPTATTTTMLAASSHDTSWTVVSGNAINALLNQTGLPTIPGSPASPIPHGTSSPLTITAPREDQGSVGPVPSLSPSSSPPHSSLPSLPSPPSALRRVILIVDDNPVNIKVLKRILAPSAQVSGKASVFDIETAISGRQAVNIYDTQADRNIEIGLILMDIVMPEETMTGLEATAKIRERDKHVPIVAVTANADTEDRVKYLSLGMNDVLGKPVNKEKLLRCVRRFMNKRQISSAEAVTQHSSPIAISAIATPLAISSPGRPGKSLSATNGQPLPAVPYDTTSLPGLVNSND